MKHSFLILFLIFFVAPLSEAKIIDQEVQYTSEDVTLNGYLAYDDQIQGKRPGILVVHEWWGHNDYARRRTRMLAEMGYIAFAVDMYGDGKKADHPQKAGEFSNQIRSDMQGKGKSRFLAALTVLKEHPMTARDQIAAIGYCFGGGTVLHMARLGVDLKGVVSFHGSLKTDTPAKAGDVRAKVLVCHGAEDKFIPQEDIDAFKKEMEDAQVDYTFKSYEGAVHSFTNPEADSFAERFQLPLAYNRQADQQSWQDMQAFFKRIFSNVEKEIKSPKQEAYERGVREKQIAASYVQGDMDGDNDLDKTDIDLFEKWLGKCEKEGYSEVADANHDGCVTEDDRLLLFPISKDQALKIADKRAKVELENYNNSKYARDTGVFKFKNYKRKVLEDIFEEEEIYFILYEYKMPPEEMETRLMGSGHPWHFSIWVTKSTGRVQFFGGQ